MCLCAYTRVHTWMCVTVEGRGQPHVWPSGTSSISFEIESLIGLELTYWLAKKPGISLSPPPQAWDYNCQSSTWHFYIGSCIMPLSLGIIFSFAAGWGVPESFTDDREMIQLPSTFFTQFSNIFFLWRKFWCFDCFFHQGLKQGYNSKCLNYV